MDVDKPKNVIELNNNVLKNFLAPISFQALKDLIKSWKNGEIGDNYDSKLSLFTSVMGNSIEEDKFKELFLLRESFSTLSNKNWKIFKFQLESLENIDIDNLKEQLKEKLKKLSYNKFNINVFNVVDLGIYIIIDLPTTPRVIEEMDFSFKVYQPIERLRFLFNKEGFVQVFVISEIKQAKFLQIFEELLNTKITSVPIYSYVIRDFIYKMSPIQKLTVVCPREMGGFSGVEKITVEGPDVVNGMEDLRSRQEILFNFQGLSKLGAWTTVKCKTAKMNVYGNLKIKDKETKEKIFKFIE
ncbi:MAG: hypothetical protein EAX96_19095 [Candidatus Lokiarchaeota archaeon]|nr:hypothetical protein [Candidatus Lokiarchaeota archaeon]